MLKTFQISILLIIVTLIGCIETDTSDDSVSDGGSTSGFAIQNGYMYVVTDNQLSTFNLVLPNMPQPIPEFTDMAFGLETIIPYKDNLLLIGTTTGVLIYQSWPDGSLTHEGTFSHLLGCDPVIAKNNIAYSTVNSGNNCRAGGDVNQLYVIDINDINSPTEIQTIELNSPEGLIFFENSLLVCNGDYSPINVFEIGDDGQLQSKGLIDLGCKDMIRIKEDTLALPSKTKTQFIRISTGEEIDPNSKSTEAISSIEIGSFPPIETSQQRQFIWETLGWN